MINVNEPIETDFEVTVRRFFQMNFACNEYKIVNFEEKKIRQK